jgi:hypothetical protein
MNHGEYHSIVRDWILPIVECKLLIVDISRYHTISYPIIRPENIKKLLYIEKGKPLYNQVLDLSINFPATKIPPIP